MEESTLPIKSKSRCIPLTIFMFCVLCGLICNCIIIFKELLSDDENKDDIVISKLVQMFCGFICTIPCFFIIKYVSRFLGSQC